MSRARIPEFDGVDLLCENLVFGVIAGNSGEDVVLKSIRMRGSVAPWMLTDRGNALSILKQERSIRKGEVIAKFKKYIKLEDAKKRAGFPGGDVKIVCCAYAGE